MTLKMEIK